MNQGNYPNYQPSRLNPNAGLVADPNVQIQQMMRGFGGLQNEEFMVPMNFNNFNPMEDMMQFSNLHKNVYQQGQQGSFVSQTFVSSSKMGEDGRLHNEHYFENSIGESKNGNTISQKQQGYKNTEGINRIAEERMLNEKGRKVVKEKIGNNVDETNHYYNIDDTEVEKFDSDWRQVDQSTGFLKNHLPYLQNEPRQRQIGFNEPSYQSPISYPYQSPISYQPSSQQNYQPSSQQNYQPLSQQNYQPLSQQNYQPTRSQSSQYQSISQSPQFHGAQYKYQPTGK